jgi:YfiH family protein
MTVPAEPRQRLQQPALRWLTPEWPAPPNVRALSTLRGGGVSEGVFASLNLGGHVGDSAAAVAENRRLLRAAAGLPGEPEWLAQVHGNCVKDLDRDLDRPATYGGSEATVGAGAAAVPGVGAAAGAANEAAAANRANPVNRANAAIAVGAANPAAANALAVADAAVTRRPGRICAILTADCLPVLFASMAGDRVGAAHAGWRGLAAGVIEATVAALGCPPRELLAWLGPAIGPRHFEIGDEVRRELLRSGAGGDGDGAAYSGDAAAFVLNARGRYLADLYALARRRLEQLGVAGIYGGGECTYSDIDKYFSHRRDGRTGRQASLIWLEGP